MKKNRRQKTSKSKGFSKEIHINEEAKKSPKKRGGRKWFWITAGIVLFLVLVLGGVYLWSRQHLPPVQEQISRLASPSRVKIPVVKPKFPALLTGELKEKEKVDLRPFAVVIENHPASRPSSGLSKAGLVFESLTEGGITRFLAFFDELPDEIGPIRSARTYFVDWAQELGAFFVHCGGSTDALKKIRTLSGFYDINQFYFGRYFWRDRHRFAPHNLYTSKRLLENLRRAKGWPEKATYTPWPFKDEAPQTERGKLKKATINFSSASFRVVYVYDPKENVYVRYLAGKPHKDKDGTLIKVKNVVLAYYSGYQYSSEGHTLWHFNTRSQGRVKVLRDGKVIEGTWSFSDRTRFFDSKGVEIKLNRGTTWVEVIAPSVSVVLENSD